MRVLQVDSAASWRGGQNQVLLTSRALARLGHEVALACQERGVLEARAREAGLGPHPLVFRGDVSPGAAWGLRRLARSFEPEVVHAHDPHAIAAALLAGLGRRLVATRRVDFPLRGALSRLKYSRCRGIIAVSRAIEAVLLREGLAAARIRVVYEGVPDRPPLPGGEAALSALGIPEGAPVIGNVAQLTDHKDQRTLVAAMPRVLSALPEARLVIVGEGELRGALESQVAALGLRPRVSFAGFRDDLDRLLPAFTVFCLSSRLEGLGTSLLDAMAFGRPIVATAAGGIPEAVADGVTGRLAPPGDPEGLASALIEVLRSHELQRRLGEAGRTRFLEHFTDRRMAEGTLEAYEAFA
jgi:glycosyltransferase involved in cell wall biosynthesis